MSLPNWNRRRYSLSAALCLALFVIVVAAISVPMLTGRNEPDTSVDSALDISPAGRESDRQDGSPQPGDAVNPLAAEQPQGLDAPTAVSTPTADESQTIVVGADQNNSTATPGPSSDLSGEGDTTKASTVKTAPTKLAASEVAEKEESSIPKTTRRTTTERVTTATKASAQTTATKRTTTKPPTTKPLTAEPPTTKRTTTRPSTTPPPTTQRPTTRPTTQPPTTQRPTTKPPITQRPTTQRPTTQPPTTQRPTNPGGGVVWEENFNSFDSSRWKKEHSTYGDGNNELQCYRPENVWVTGGKLVLRAVNESYTCPNGSTRRVTSGMVRSRGVTFSPGQALEFKVKLNPADHNNQGGLWPAVWASGWGGGGWPRGGELDFLEVMTAVDPKRTIKTLHYTKPNGQHGHTSNGGHYMSENFSARWHTFRFDYGSDGVLVWYQDGQEVHRITHVDTIQGYPDPFNKPITELKINLALGGSPGPLDTRALGSQGATYEIDYIRIRNLN